VLRSPLSEQLLCLVEGLRLCVQECELQGPVFQEHLLLEGSQLLKAHPLRVRVELDQLGSECSLLNGKGLVHVPVHQVQQTVFFDDLIVLDLPDDAAGRRRGSHGLLQGQLLLFIGSHCCRGVVGPAEHCQLFVLGVQIVEEGVQVLVLGFYEELGVEGACQLPGAVQARVAFEVHVRLPEDFTQLD
jgi:hypothetical protein